MGPCIIIIFQYIYPTKCNVTQFIFSGNCSTCFGWYLHPSSDGHRTVSTASVVCHTVIAICCYRGRVGTSLRVLWVAYIRVLSNSYYITVFVQLVPACRSLNL